MWKITRNISQSLRRCLWPLLLLIGLGQAGAAQNLFAPVVRIDDAVVTEYEVQQRQRFLQLLNAPGATREAAIEALIDDRLRARAAREAGLELPPEAIREGMREFAGRADLQTDEFIAALNQSGVSEETFRDFVTVNIAWRELIRARYADRVQISRAEIDRARAADRGAGGLRVLLSEIIIPAPPPRAAEVAALAERISKTRSTAEFSSFARQYSATASRERGGQMPWTPLEKLPPAIQPLIRDLAPGEVTAPLPIPNAVALFQLRAIEETGAPAQNYAQIDYAAYHIPGGRSDAALTRAAQIRAEIDTCDDLYGINQGGPAGQLERKSESPAQIPQDIAIELAKLDPGEVSTALTRADGRNLVFLMLCGRTASANAEVSEEAVVNSLRQRRLEGYSAQLLEQLRANSRIRRP
ncbi:peptidylprolyl isomerase [Sulfitobacter aestuarii]|uniref:Parvulin-like PPIase n=1 Tax=Sulfitobacter aestuarii TaxID=2161676 RepID=A0ABW5U0S1_9RHOB